jgi:hypothetical protein
LEGGVEHRDERRHALPPYQPVVTAATWRTRGAAFAERDNLIGQTAGMGFMKVTHRLRRAELHDEAAHHVLE